MVCGNTGRYYRPARQHRRFSCELPSTNVSNRELPQRRGSATQCSQTEPVRGQFVAFLHAESASSSRGAVTLCYADCARQFVLDPAKHLLPARPHMSIRLGDLSPDAAMSDQLSFRVALDPVPPDVVPIALIKIRGNWHPYVWSLRSSGPDRWDHGVTFARGASERHGSSHLLHTTCGDMVISSVSRTGWSRIEKIKFVGLHELAELIKPAAQ